MVKKLAGLLVTREPSFSGGVCLSLQRLSL
jgi:hypothetical protein